MGTWAVQATATRATVSSAISLRGLSARFRELVGVMVVRMLGDDDDEPTSAAAAPDDSYPYYLGQDRLALDAPEAEPQASEPQASDPAPNGAQKQRHTPRHAAPSPTLAAKLSSAKPKLPGFAAKSSHAGW